MSNALHDLVVHIHECLSFLLLMVTFMSLGLRTMHVCVKLPCWMNLATDNIPSNSDVHLYNTEITGPGSNVTILQTTIGKANNQKLASALIGSQPNDL